MGLFRPTPMELNYGEPVHVMLARALMHDAIKVDSDIMPDARYHFVGPHGIEYRGKKTVWRDETCAHGVASLCEDIQQDFNERIAAVAAARQYAKENLSIPALFRSVADD